MIECCINLCPSNSSDGEVSFYRFPVIRSDSNRQSSIERRSAWIRAVGRKNIDWDLAVVCSRHFASGRPSQLYEQDSPDWVPSLEMKGEGLKRATRKVAPPNAAATEESSVAVEEAAAPMDVEQSILGSLLLAPSVDPPPPKMLLAVQQNPIEETIRNNLTKICRLCLSKEVRLTRPFQGDGGPDDSLLQQIYECTTVKITLKASYPASICAICDTKLSEYSKFREKCIENDELLRTILDGDKIGQEEDDIVDVVPVEENEESMVDNNAANASIQSLEFHESNEIRNLQLQLYGSSDENTVSQSEFVGSEETPVAPLPKITSVTSNVPIDTNASTSARPSSVVSIGAPSPALDEPTKLGKVASPSPKPTISVKSLASLAATTSVVSPEPAASETGSSTSQEVDKATTVPTAYGQDGRLECTICARPFRNSYTLRRHMNLHTEENLHTCEYCGKKFNDRSNWKIHLRAHTGDNLLRCVICFKTFISPSTLKYHLRAHRKLKVFECRFCVETTTTYEDLADHIAAKHGDVRLEDYAKLSEESFMAGDFLKIEMEADETTLTVTVPRSSNAASSEAGSEMTLQLPSLNPAPTDAAASVSQVKVGTDETAVKIKEEVLDPDEIQIKQEPMDDDTLGAMVLNAGHSEVQQQLTALIPPTDEEAPPVILFRCDYCMKIFKYLYELRVHMRIHNGAKGMEKSSSKGSAKPPPAKKARHPSIDEDIGELENAPLPEHECPKCDKCFRTEELLRVHIETHKMDDDVTMARSCKVCFKTFKCELNLVSHMRKHHRYQAYVSDQEQQVQHVQKKAEPILEKPQSPDSSSNDGGNQSQSESVDTSSTAEGGGGSNTTRKCEICALSFDCSYKLEQHMLTHFKNNEAVAFVPSADRPYKCTECHKRFKRKDYLLIHIRTHTGERRHKCDMCSSAFVHPSNLITHRKLHSNERPFKCDLCPAAFKLFAGLKIHRKRCVLKYLQENSVAVAD